MKSPAACVPGCRSVPGVSVPASADRSCTTARRATGRQRGAARERPARACCARDCASRFRRLAHDAAFAQLRGHRPLCCLAHPRQRSDEPTLCHDIQEEISALNDRIAKGRIGPRRMARRRPAGTVPRSLLLTGGPRGSSLCRHAERKRVQLIGTKRRLFPGRGTPGIGSKRPHVLNDICAAPHERTHRNLSASRTSTTREKSSWPIPLPLTSIAPGCTSCEIGSNERRAM